MTMPTYKSRRQMEVEKQLENKEKYLKRKRDEMDEQIR